MSKLKTIEFVYSKGQKLSLKDFKKNKEHPDLTVIWLHGLGASGDDFVPVVPMLGLDLDIHYIFPHAPIQAVTINGGMPMPSWYDILELIVERKINAQQFDQSVSQIHSIMDERISHAVNSKNILVIGFSQGGAVALNSVLTYSKPLAGVIALSTYLAKEPIIHSANQKTPVIWFHGTYDDVVPISLSAKAARFFENQTNPFELKTYAMRHEVSLEEIRDIAITINQLGSE